MNGFAEIFDVLNIVEECLDQSDWDRLGAIVSPDPVLPDGATNRQIQAALEAIEATQARLQDQMDSIADNFAAVPAVRKAARAYLHS